MKSGSLNLLETSGPHRASYGTPLPFIRRFLCEIAILVHGHEDKRLFPYKNNSFCIEYRWSVFAVRYGVKIYFVYKVFLCE